MRTMRNLWSAVSGTINDAEEPLKRAYIEIFEETGITCDSLRLCNSDQSVTVDSPEHDCTLQIYGFLFASASSSVKLNWESSEYRWVLRKEIDSLDAVVRLGDVLDALL